MNQFEGAAMKLTNKELNKIKDITFRYDLHYKMWDWLNKHPDKGKDDYFELYPDEVPIAGFYDCFACEYAFSVIKNIRKYRDMCKFCPLKADNRKLCLGGLHSKWVDAKGDKKYKLAAKYAKQIRDLPLNPMYNFKDAE